MKIEDIERLEKGKNLNSEIVKLKSAIKDIDNCDINNNILILSWYPTEGGNVHNIKIDDSNIAGWCLNYLRNLLREKNNKLQKEFEEL